MMRNNRNKKKMPNFVYMAFKNNIDNLPQEINADFIEKVARMAKKVVVYERIYWPWDAYRSPMVRLLYKNPEKIMGDIVKMAEISSSDDKESFLIFIGVFFSRMEFSCPRREMEQVMKRFKETLLAIISSREEAEIVAKYAGYNVKANILLSWFPLPE